MTPVFCCGAECGQIAAAGAGVGQHWTKEGAGGTASISTSIFRNGLRSIRMQLAAEPTGSVLSSVLTSSNIWVIRVYIYFSSLPTNNADLLSVGTFLDGVGFKSSDSKIYPCNGITFGASGFTVTTNTWYCIDLKINASANPHTIDVSVNGNPLTQHTNAQAAQNNTQIRLGKQDATNNISVDMYYDDIVVSNTSADFPIGNGVILPHICTSDGTHNIAGTGDFQRTLTGTDILNATTTVYQLIDDIPLESGAGVDWINMVAPPNATDYVECLFGPAPGTPTPTYGPRAVEVIAGIHQAGTGNGNMEIRINDNGTTNAMYTATGVAGTTSIIYKRKHYASAINGGGAWGVASGAGNFNNLRVRFGSPATVDANPDQYLDCIMIEAEFAEWPQKIVNIKQAVNRASTY